MLLGLYVLLKTKKAYHLFDKLFFVVPLGLERNLIKFQKSSKAFVLSSVLVAFEFC